MDIAEVITRIEYRLPSAFFLNVHMIGVEVNKHVLGTNTFNHLHRLPTSVEQMRFVPVDRLDPEKQSQ